jgi:quinol-cytochrome oxidoreductase complex cytochrome b subunit
MSFWGAIVITSLASAILVVGDTIVTWLWGGFSVDNATLNRFFSPHYLLPFIIIGAAILHLVIMTTTDKHKNHLVMRYYGLYDDAQHQHDDNHHLQMSNLSNKS